jgi:WD40 repeat protein
VAFGECACLFDLTTGKELHVLSKESRVCKTEDEGEEEEEEISCSPIGRADAIALSQTQVVTMCRFASWKTKSLEEFEDKGHWPCVVEVWSIETGELQNTLVKPPDEDIAYSSGGEGSEDGEEHSTCFVASRVVAIDPNSRFIVSSWTDGYLRVWGREDTTEEDIDTLELPGMLCALALEIIVLDGGNRHVLIAGSGEPDNDRQISHRKHEETASAEGYITVYQLEQGTLLSVFRPNKNFVVSRISCWLRPSNPYGDFVCFSAVNKVKRRIKNSNLRLNWDYASKEVMLVRV